MDVVVDGLMVCQQRIDPETGSENLQAYSWICFSIGGTFFGLAGGFLLENLSPSFVFYVTAALGLVITVNGFFTSKKLEEGSAEIINMGFCQRLKLNFREIVSGFKIRALYRCVLFFLIFCSFVPSFTNYFYYYLIDVLGFTNFQYAILNVVASIALLVTVYFYNIWLKNAESSAMLVVCCILNAVGGVNSMLLIRGFTYGMEPKAFVFLSATVTDTLQNAIRLLAGNVLFAKLIPANIESSMFAILTGIMNFCNFFLAKQLGNFVNLFVGVTDKDLDKLWILFAVMVVCSFFPIFFIWLVPSRKEVFLVQQVNEFLEKYPRKSSKVKDNQSDTDDADIPDRTNLIDDIMKLDPACAKQMGIYLLYKEELGEGFEHPARSEPPSLPAATQEVVSAAD